MTANLKRESKAYSYEDQKWDLQVRKELTRRRRLNSNSDDVSSMLKEATTLTAKQREAITTQLAREEDIRERMKVLDRHLMAVDLLLEMLCAHSVCIPLLPLLVSPVLCCMNSPLAGGHAINMWHILISALFADKKNG